MRVAVCSDLHLEFGDVVLKNTENADLLILSGDITVARELPYSDSGHGSRAKDFFRNVSSEFPMTVYVAGNHEHYHGDFKTTGEIIREALKDFPNVKYLDKETIKLDGVTVIGGTLWTNMNNLDPLTMYHVDQCMNDFRLISNSNNMVSYKKQMFKRDASGELMRTASGAPVVDGFEFSDRPSAFSVNDAINQFFDYTKYIEEVIRNNPDDDYIVVGHHAPSKQSTHPYYKDDVLMNGGYSSDLDEFILGHPQIRLWTHGHTHEPFDYIIGSTRIVCNPRGYIGHEQRATDFQLKFIDV